MELEKKNPEFQDLDLSAKMATLSLPDDTMGASGAHGAIRKNP